MTIYDDYFDYCDEYIQKYGDKTIIFMQVGDFFELYAVQNKKEKLGADIFKIAELCNIIVSRKNKSVNEISRSNPYMAGFPISAISKFIQITIQSQYTCVIIRQVTPPPLPKREVTEIISPSTNINVNSNEGTYLFVVYWDEIKDFNTSINILSVGISIVDITTGSIYIYEAFSKIDDIDFAKDEVHRYLNIYEPKEVVFIGNISNQTKEELENQFCNSRNMVFHKKWYNENIKLFENINYQLSILETVYGKTCIPLFELLHIDRCIIGNISFCYMLQFIYDHNEEIIGKISKPIICKNEKHLILESNCAYQLNVLSNSIGETPLLSILNRTNTAFGSRLFKYRLLNPVISKETLEERYDMIECFKQNNIFEELNVFLSSILDIERMNRRISISKFVPSEWSNFDNSFEMIYKIIEYIKNYDINASFIKKDKISKIFDEVTEIIKFYKSFIKIDECIKYVSLNDIYNSIFQEGIYEDIDKLSNTIKKNFNEIEYIKDTITNLTVNDNTLCRIDCNEKDGYHLTTTKKRWDNIIKTSPEKIIIDKNTTLFWKDCKAKPLSSSSSNLRITHSYIDKLSDTIILKQRKLSILCIEYYKQFLQEFYEKYNSSIKEITLFIAEIDISCTNARNSVEYNYSRPDIIDNCSTSFLKAKSLRHPIIERLNTRTEYISNDIELGQDKKGLLLYGINASGKSSFMKSIGINVIMAQSGMYVASKHFELSPYHHIFTRISGMDNIYRGLSTFTVEMLELKNILNRCDKNSLILGDELCAGTEAVSAISIVASGINELSNKNANYIFATHLHELLDVDFIKDNKQIQISHMHIEFEEKTGKIIYDRKLQDGDGSRLYGIEVCKYLNLPSTFIETANKIRKNIQNVSLYIVNPKQSKYNSALYVSKCAICKKPATETHHIKHQQHTDNNGYIDNTYKNDLHNLIPLCEDCHLQQHHGEIIIDKYITTSEGIEIKTKNIKKETCNKKINTDYNLLKPYLIYDIKGWKYKTRTNWKLLKDTEYCKIFKKISNILDIKLPNNKNEIEYYLECAKDSLLSL